MAYIDRGAVALKVKRHLMPNVDIDGTVSAENAERYFLNLLAEQPAADVDKVVRCKECVYSGKTSDDEEDYYCQNKHGLNGYICDVSFCSNGKRKEGAKDA